DRACHVHRLAESGVSINDRRQFGHASDLLCTTGYLGEGREPDVGKPEIGGEHGARNVDTIETLFFNEACRERVERSWEAEQFTRFELLAEDPPLFCGCCFGVQHIRRVPSVLWRGRAGPASQ